ncbi:PIG-L family deacetylase [Kribbella sp. NBC_01505]|uniref:PIG-L deacetylase family protein n=1 Tax=Kribbella sp. NBC_01505 TaxID=2903580 RepID=UPI00386DF034
MPTALVIHAHPDDEVFATGAATSVLSSEGWQVALRVATAGVGTAANRLPGSCELLGIHEWDWLGGSDRWIDDGGQGGPRTVAAADPSAIAAEVVKAIRGRTPDLVLTVGSDGLTGHPDHIAVSRAVQLAVRQEPRRTLGARLRAQDVRAGQDLLKQLLPDAQIGSGRVVGCPEGTELELVEGASEDSRRQALDQYYDRLGTGPLAELVRTHNSRSDGLLLRAVFDATGWQYDRFEVLCPGA